MKLIMKKLIIMLVGGIEAEVFINGNRDFRISLLVDKSQNKYSVGTSVVSKELANFLEQ